MIIKYVTQIIQWTWILHNVQEQIIRKVCLPTGTKDNTMCFKKLSLYSNCDIHKTLSLKQIIQGTQKLQLTVPLEPQICHNSAINE